MAGATTPDNLPYPTTGDEIAPIEPWWTTLAQRVQTALSAIRGDIAAVHNVETIPQASFGTVAPGHTVTYYGMRRTGNVVSGSLRIERAGGFTHSAPIFTVNAAYRPAVAWKFTLPATGAGGGTGASTLSCNVDENGVIALFSPKSRTVVELALTWVINP